MVLLGLSTQKAFWGVVSTFVTVPTLVVVVPPVTELVAAVRAVVDHGMKQPIGAPEAKPKLIEMAEALIRLERSLKR